MHGWVGVESGYGLGGCVEWVCTCVLYVGVGWVGGLLGWTGSGCGWVLWRDVCMYVCMCTTIS